jgi:hypothetical protein
MGHADQALVRALIEIAIPAHIAPRATTANRFVPRRETRIRASVRAVRSVLRSSEAAVTTIGQT